MRIIALQVEAKVYEVMRGDKSTLMVGHVYKQKLTRPAGKDSLGNPIEVLSGATRELPIEHNDPSIQSKFFQIDIRPENGKDMSDTAVVNVAKDLDKTILDMMSKGGIYLDLLKDVKSHSGRFPIVIVAIDSSSYSSMFQLDSNIGSYAKEMYYRTSKSNSLVPSQSIFLMLSFNKEGKPLFRPHQHTHVIIHELMHKLDLVTSTKSVSVSKLVKALRQKPIYTSDYSKTNKDEMIAELLTHYYLKASYPEYSQQYKQLETIADSLKIVISKR